MDERRLLVAVLLSAVIVVLWQLIFPSPPPPDTETPEGQEELLGSLIEEDEGTAVEEPTQDPIAPPISQELEVPLAPEEDLEPLEAELERTVVVERGETRVELSNRGAQLISFQIAGHLEADGSALELVRQRPGDVPHPFALVGPEMESLGLNEALFQVEEWTEDGGIPVVEFRYRGSSGASRKLFRFVEKDIFEVKVEVEGESEWGLLLGPGLRNPDAKERESRYLIRSAVYQRGGEVEQLYARKMNDGAEEVPGAGVAWLGLEDTYFLTALIPQSPFRRLTAGPVLEEKGEDGVTERLIRITPELELSDAQKKMPRDVVVILQPGAASVELTAYWGSKKYDRLASTPWGLERTIDWGMFGFISRPLLWVLNWIYDNLAANYGWAVVLTTLLLKIILLPLTHKSHVSMEKMQKLNPKMQAVRQKYRGKLRDKQGRFNSDAQRKMNEELQALYKQEGVNPAGGCVPMLLQLPVFFAFFRLLPSAVELRRAPWILWVRDLSAPDPLYLLPVLMGASQFWQQKLTPSSADPMQRRIFQLFPFMFTIFAFSFPSGLVLYWLVNNILTMVQIAVYKKLKERKAARGRRTGSSQKD